MKLGQNQQAQAQYISCEQILRNLEIGSSAWIRYVANNGITFVLITRLASDRFRLSHYVNAITMGTLSQISDAIRGIKDLKNVSITKVEAGDLR
jgi:LPS sulfotransferase NodH